MTLKSGDRIFFDVATSHMTLQFMSKKNLEKEVGECDDSRPETLDTIDGNDTVVLRGADVAVLLEALSGLAYSKTVVEVSRPGTSRLYVRTEAKSCGKTLLVGDGNEITMTQAERFMFSDAVRSRVWRLYQ